MTPEVFAASRAAWSHRPDFLSKSQIHSFAEYCLRWKQKPLNQHALSQVLSSKTVKLAESMRGSWPEESTQDPEQKFLGRKFHQNIGSCALCGGGDAKVYEKAGY
jgi:hypothetical protein